MRGFAAGFGGHPGPRRAKLLFAPHAHCGWADMASSEGFSIQVEQRRFFDYWLNGIDNGVMREPAVTYSTCNAPAGQAWRQAATWPLPSETRAKFYLKADGLDRRAARTVSHQEAAMGPPAEVSSILLRQPPGGLTYETAPRRRSGAGQDAIGHRPARDTGMTGGMGSDAAPTGVACQWPAGPQMAAAGAAGA